MGLFKAIFGTKKNSEHHYVIAHQMLRKVAFSEPVRIFGSLGSVERIAFLNSLISDMQLHMPDAGRCSFRGADIKFTACMIHGRACAILEMPPAQNPVEAYFIALVSRLPAARMQQALGDSTTTDLLDYYTFGNSLAVCS